MGYLNPGWINDLNKIQPLAANNLIPGLMAESHIYLTLAAPCQGFNATDVNEYTKELLKWLLRDASDRRGPITPALCDQHVPDR